MPKFLPKEADNAAFSITEPARDTFAAEKVGFIQDVAQKMAVDAVNDIGRIPSLLSLAYSFYTDLFPGELAVDAEKRVGRAEAQKRARREFRGIASVLALRGLLGIDIRLKKFNPLARPSGTVNPFREVFDALYSESPGFQSRQGWSDFRYLVVHTQPEEGPEVDEAICGLSPYTLFYPAASRLRACRTIFWYDPESGTWRDPTTDWTERPDPNLPAVSYEVIKVLRGFVRRWLDGALADRLLMEAWECFGLTTTRADKLKKELEAWRSDLSGPETVSAPADVVLDKASLGLETRNAKGDEFTVPVLEQKITGKEGRIVSELPRVNGRVLLSESLLAENTNIRVCGRLMSNPDLKGCLNELAPEGNEFTLLVGKNQYRIKEPYVVVDKLFLDTIHLLADGSLSEKFFALDVSTGTAEEEHWMLPFRPPLLRYLDIEKLRSSREQVRLSQVCAARVGDGGNDLIKVGVQINGQWFYKQYSGGQRNRDTAGNALDVRVWPNFRFPVSPRTPVPAGDRVYYFRVRQQPGWGLCTQVLARLTVVNGMPQPETGPVAFVPDTRAVGWPVEFDRFRLAQCFAFSTTGPTRADDGASATGDWEPIGLYFESRGLCLLRLADPQLPGSEEPIKWRVGVDFGTSNTCVTFRSLQQGVTIESKTLQFEMQTDTLHDPPRYDEIPDRPDAGGETEGAAAVLDFPYKYEKVAYLTDKQHFPSLLVTRQAAAPQDANFRMSNGLIFPRNVILDNKDIGGLLKDYPPLPSPDRRLFRLVTEVKWANDRYRKTFLWHLYKMISLEAARNGAVVIEAAFSFPRAFDRNKITEYRNEVNAVFQQHGGIAVNSNDFVTESEAVHRWFVANPDRRAHLVLDVGGGTTDYLAVLDDQARLQASYYFAASYLNDYFAASPCLQQALRDAIYRVVSEKPAGPEYNLQKSQRLLLDKIIKSLSEVSREALPQFKSYCYQAFFGMLGMMDDCHYALVVGELFKDRPGSRAATEQRAICGFFHTLVLLYTGMVYIAGRLMRQEDLSSANLQIDFIGNGSRFYRFLKNDATAFNKVLQRVFQASISGNLEVIPEIAPEGKALVAKGLLVRKEKDGRFDAAPIIADQNSMAYLRDLAAKGDASNSHDYGDLAEFLDLLNQQLPGGRLDQVTVIPFLQASLKTELTNLFPKMVASVRRAERKNAERLIEHESKAQQLKDQNPTDARAFEEAALATEPIFISRLRCLLDTIREEYAA